MEAIEYLFSKSHGMVEMILTFPRRHHQQRNVQIVLAGGAPSRSLRPATGRSTRPHDWDFFCVGAWADVLFVLMSLFEVLGQHPSYSTFTFSSMTLTFYFLYPQEALMKLQFILQAYLTLGKYRIFQILYPAINVVMNLYNVVLQAFNGVTRHI